ncbi:gluconolactonase [hydrocarbon metagenome]|uniref:Gluconolactonase n=1 Tax=hydrocarbon metagenome TaxID=938273 RepID=A0A0W8FXD7_9ZZZZ
MKNDPHKYSDRIELIFDGGFFTEGPAVDSDGNVYFTDLTFTSETGNEPGHIWRYSPVTNETKIYRSPSNMANGMIIKNDTLYTCEGADTGGRRLIKTDLSTGKSFILTDNFNGKPYNSPNDLTIADDGTIYFTDPRYSGDESIEQPLNGVYRLNVSGQVELIINNISMPNGITVTPDNKKLYVGCNDENADEDNPNFISEYLIDKEGNATFNKYLAKYLAPTGPDGIKLDKYGLIYAALRDPYRPGIYVYSSEGMLIEKVILPEDPSNLIFADESQEILYVTAGGNLYKVLFD